MVWRLTRLLCRVLTPLSKPQPTWEQQVTSSGAASGFSLWPSPLEPGLARCQLVRHGEHQRRSRGGHPCSASAPPPPPRACGHRRFLRFLRTGLAPSQAAPCAVGCQVAASPDEAVTRKQQAVSQRQWVQRPPKQYLDQGTRGGSATPVRALRATTVYLQSGPGRKHVTPRAGAPHSPGSCEAFGGTGI